MFDLSLLKSLPQIPAPVLTAYLETNPADSRNLRHPPGYLIWLKSQAKNIEGSVPEAERRAFREQLQLLETHLIENPPRARSMIIFAGPETWQAIPLRVEAEDELSWGPPSLTQMLWLMEEHRPCGVVLPDRSGARFFHYWMGEMTEDHDAQLKIDTSEWRRKDLMPPSLPGIEYVRGSDRDAFDHRIEANIVRFYAREAERIRAWADARKLQLILLIGPPKLVEVVWQELPKSTQSRALLIQEDIGHLPELEFQTRVESEVQKWEHARDRDLIEELFGSDAPRIVLGVNQTLSRLQEGLVNQALAISRLDGQVWQCPKCGWTDRASDSTCPICGTARQKKDLRAVLPPLVKQFKVPFEVVAEDVGERLSKAGGIGAWLKSEVP